MVVLCFEIGFLIVHFCQVLATHKMHCLAVVQMCVFSYDRGVMESYSHVANLESEGARPKEGKRYNERERGRKSCFRVDG